MSVVADVIMNVIVIMIMMIVEIGKFLGKSALKKSALFLFRDNRENKKRELMLSFFGCGN
ncbi:hypothetical protein ACT7C2_06145 [Bacillus pacificus]